MLLSNYLAVLTQPTYQKPIKNLDDFLASSKGVLMFPEGSGYPDYLAESTVPAIVELGARMYAAKDYDEYDIMMEEIHTKNKDVSINPWIEEFQWEYGYWYQSGALP